MRCVPAVLPFGGGAVTLRAKAEIATTTMNFSALLLVLVLLDRSAAQKIRELEQKIVGLMSILKTEMPSQEAYQRCGCSSPPTVVKYGAKIGWACEQHRDLDPKKHDESSCGEICIGPPKGQQSPHILLLKINRRSY